MEKGIGVILIDSGISEKHNVFSGITVNKISLCKDSSCYDAIGHGTAVASIIAANCNQIPLSITMIKVFGDNAEVDDDELLEAMKYIIRENIEGRIINISCGVNRTARIAEYENVCNALYEQGRIIVAAFTPVNGITYPAACKHVVGVDISTENFRPCDYIYSENSPITIRGSAYPVRVAVPGGGFVNSVGSSFSCAYITSLIAKYLYENKVANYDEVCSFLKSKAARIKTFKDRQEIQQPGTIYRSALFPFNKEMHSLLSFADMLPFSIDAVYDIRYNRKIGSKVFNHIPRFYSSKDYTVENIESIRWDIDTMILGNVSKLSAAMKYNIKRRLALQCLENGVNVYSFDRDGIDDNLIEEFRKIGKWCYVPEVKGEHIITNTYGRMFNIALPVVGIFGTSPKQGKYTLQLLLRKWMIDHNYNICQLGTEPTSLLFGMDGIYNMGLNSTVNISGLEAIQYVNDMIAKMQRQDKDLVLVGSQSQSVLNGEGSIGFVPSAQFELLMGSQPDAVILCINYFDDENYIGRTVKYIESSVGCKVIAILIFPFQYDNYQGHLIGKERPIEKRLLDERCKQLEEDFSIHVEPLTENCENIGNLILSFFEERDL